MRSISVWTAVAVSVFAVGCRQTPMERLIAASKGMRITEARLCAFPYAPRPRVMRGDEPEPPSKLRLKAIAGELLDSAVGQDAESQHAHALSQFLWHSSEAAAKELEILVTANRADARGWSDLAAVRYELARKNDDAQGFASALAAAAAAVEANPSLPEAHFNYAFAAAALHLDNAAAAALKEYLSIDGASAWAAEARQRLAALERPKPDWKTAAARIERVATTATDIQRAVTAFPQQTRTWAEGEYLARWGEAYVAHRDADAEQWLSLARSIGRVLRDKSGESMVHDAVHAIDSADAAGRVTLANAHLTYRRGRILYSKHNAGEAIPLLAESERLFSTGGSPLSLVARYYRANALTDREETVAAVALLKSLTSVPAGYRALHAHIQWQRAYVLDRIGHFHEALQASNDSLLGFERLNEPENACQMLINTMAILARMGRAAEAVNMSRRAFEAASAATSTLLTGRALNTAARIQLRFGHRDIARTLLDIELSSTKTSPRMHVDALLQRLNASDGDASDLQRMYAAAAEIADPKLREEALDDVRLAMAARDGDAMRAATSLSQCIEFRRQNKSLATLTAAYLARARAYRRANRLAEAAADTDAAMTIIEGERSKIASDELRDSFLDTERALYAEAFALAVAQRDYRRGFDIVERSRARILLDRSASDSSLLTEPMPIAQIASRLPPDAALAQFTVTDGEVVILTIRQGRFDAHLVSSPSLTADVAAFAQSLDRERAASLYDRLIRPMASEMAGASDLVVIPDDLLSQLPFAALIDRATGKYLIEETALTVAPNATAFILGSRTQQRTVRRALLIGDPAFDGARFPELPRLPGADDEVKRIGSRYRDKIVLTGREASPTRVVEALADSDIAHFGTHAVVSPSDASQSALALASDEGNSGLLYLRDVTALRLPHRPIVILAGCRTASAAAGHGALRSLAMAFLAAGSRSVIGSLWNVDDEITVGFSLALHREIAAGERPARALRSAQLTMIRSADPRMRAPRSWSGFEAYGYN